MAHLDGAERSLFSIFLKPLLRISAFSFLIYGKKTATVFSSDQLDLTKIAIKANMNLHKPLYRQQFSSVMKIMLQRFDLRKVF